MGIVPARFHVPMSAPTASRMNTAPSAVEMPPIIASRMEAVV